MIGDGLDENTGAGPLVSKTQYDRVWSFIDAGKQEGAKVVLGGEKRSGKGYYCDPTSRQSDFPSRVLLLISFSFHGD